MAAAPTTVLVDGRAAIRDDQAAHASGSPEVHRRRPVGRIGGITPCGDPGALSRLAHALGQGAQILANDRHSPLVADWDCCWVDGRAVADSGQWQALACAGGIGRVQGAFAAAWLAADGALCLARDPIGERTLYYAALADGGVAFASTLHALLATGMVGRALSLPAVASYLSYGYVPGADTLVSGIQELLPGELVRCRHGTVTRTRFWSLPDESSQEPANENALRQVLRTRLEDAVLRRLPRAEPVGAFLSGGVDSSLVVALTRRLHEPPVHTYSVSFGPGHPNELAFSSLVARHCGTCHHVLEITPAMVARHFDATAAMFSKPNGDPLTVPNALLFQQAAADVRVVLNGEGGDPCFGGPKNLPMLLAELLGDGANTQPADPYTRERSYLRAHQKCYDDLAVMLADALRDAIGGERLEAQLMPFLRDARPAGLVGKLMAANVTFKGAHHILPKVDAVSAPCGVLARTPLFDQQVVETAFAIPSRFKLHGAVEKYLLKQAVRDLLPAAIIERPKSGMLVPVEAWFKGPLRNFARERLLDGLAPWGLVRREYLERLLARRLGGLHPRHGVKIWLLLTLEAWLRTTLKQAARGSP